MSAAQRWILNSCENTTALRNIATLLEEAGCEVWLNPGWFDFSLSEKLSCPGKQAYCRGGVDTWRWPEATKGEIVTDEEGQKWLVVANYQSRMESPYGRGVKTPQWGVFARIRI